MKKSLSIILILVVLVLVAVALWYLKIHNRVTPLTPTEESAILDSLTGSTTQKNTPTEEKKILNSLSAPSQPVPVNKKEKENILKSLQ
jgi:uncharacterized protein YxeA